FPLHDALPIYRHLRDDAGGAERSTDGARGASSIVVPAAALLGQRQERVPQQQGQRPVRRLPGRHDLGMATAYERETVGRGAHRCVLTTVPDRATRCPPRRPAATRSTRADGPRVSSGPGADVIRARTRDMGTLLSSLGTLTTPARRRG